MEPLENGLMDGISLHRLTLTKRTKMLRGGGRWFDMARAATWPPEPRQEGTLRSLRGSVAAICSDSDRFSSTPCLLRSRLTRPLAGPESRLTADAWCAMIMTMMRSRGRSGKTAGENA
jgi:hypothetical protein